MTRYLDTESAHADGFIIQHRPDEHRFVVAQDDRVVGYAHYSFIDEQGIDFDGTVVEPPLRGTGLSGLLVGRAVSDDIVAGKTVHASCWYVAEFIKRHPEQLAEGATFKG